jgi:hypothetical protein
MIVTKALEGRYLDEGKLRHLLEQLFPNEHNIKVSLSFWGPLVAYVLHLSSDSSRKVHRNYASGIDRGGFFGLANRGTTRLT